jgi:hypothetical protein
VVDVLGDRTAVLATVAITSEYRPAVEGDSSLVRNPDVVGQPYHRRFREGAALGVKVATGDVDQLRLLVENQQKSPTGGHNTERLEAGVEDERSGHRVLSLPVPEPSAPIRGWWVRRHGGNASAAPSPAQGLSMGRERVHAATPRQIVDQFAR